MPVLIALCGTALVIHAKAEDMKSDPGMPMIGLHAAQLRLGNS